MCEREIDEREEGKKKKSVRKILNLPNILSTCPYFSSLALISFPLLYLLIFFASIVELFYIQTTFYLMYYLEAKQLVYCFCWYIKKIVALRFFSLYNMILSFYSINFLFVSWFHYYYTMLRNEKNRRATIFILTCRTVN